MKAEPQPKKELLILSDFVNPRCIMVYTASRDAEEFVESTRKFFNYFSKPSGYLPCFTLTVSPLYDFQEVKNYLESYNDGEEK